MNSLSMDALKQRLNRRVCSTVTLIPWLFQTCFHGVSWFLKLKPHKSHPQNCIYVDKRRYACMHVFIYCYNALWIVSIYFKKSISSCNTRHLDGSRFHANQETENIMKLSFLRTNQQLLVGNLRTGRIGSTSWGFEKCQTKRYQKRSVLMAKENEWWVPSLISVYIVLCSHQTRKTWGISGMCSLE